MNSTSVFLISLLLLMCHPSSQLYQNERQQEFESEIDGAQVNDVVKGLLLDEIDQNERQQEFESEIDGAQEILKLKYPQQSEQIDEFVECVKSAYTVENEGLFFLDSQNETCYHHFSIEFLDKSLSDIKKLEILVRVYTKITSDIQEDIN